MGYRKKYLSSQRNLDYLLRALASDDYAFRFVEDKSEFNATLNKVRELLSDARQKAREREKYYEVLIDNVRTGILTIDEVGNIHRTNAEARRLLGLDILTHINQIKRIDSTLAGVISSIEPGEETYANLDTEMGKVSLSIDATSVEIDGKTLKLVSLNNIGNTLEKNEVDSWIKLTRILTHEIMNSLAPITSLADTLLRLDGDRQSDTHKGLETISSTAKSLRSFVESYRKFTHLSAPEKSAFELRPMLEKAASLLKENPDFASLKISVLAEPEDILVYADENMLNQVTINILKNAAQACGEAEGGEISVRAYNNEAGLVVIDFENNGPAIPHEAVENIFTPFFTTKKSGSGIGLSVSRQILNMHGGSLKLTSNRDGKVVFTAIL